eukprot:5449973-Alexandrium_andersonii.AAC.1
MRACAGALVPNALPARCVPAHAVMQALRARPVAQPHAPSARSPREAAPAACAQAHAPSAQPA